MKTVQFDSTIKTIEIDGIHICMHDSIFVCMLNETEYISYKDTGAYYIETDSHKRFLFRI